MNRLWMSCCIVLFVTMVFAYEKPLTLTVGNATNTLAEALAAHDPALTLDQFYAADYDALVKDGPGRLDITADIPTTWQGEIHVVAGILRATSPHTGAGSAAAVVPMTLGDVAHGVFVHDGAALETDCATKDALSFGYEPFTIEGSGPTGEGALVCRATVNQCGFSSPFGLDLRLSGDARILGSRSAQHDFLTQNAAASTTRKIDMGGHLLTLDFGGRVVRFKMNVTNPGSINLVSGGVLPVADTRLFGDASNVFHLKNGSYIQYYDGQTANNRWALSVDGDNSAVAVQHQGSVPGLNTNFCYWLGPVMLNRNLKVKSTEVNGIGATFHNRVTGPGGFLIEGGAPTSKTPHDPYLALVCPTNDFRGGVSSAYGHLHLFADGALPANVGKGSLQNSSIEFQGAARGKPFALPPIDVVGTGVVANAGGAWTGAVVKVGSGALTVDARLTDESSVDIQAGSFMLARVVRSPGSGLYGGEKVMKGWHSPDGSPQDYASNGYYSTLVLTNGIFQSPEMAYRAPISDIRMATYEGYIWNRETTNVTWSFAHCFETCSKFLIDGVDMGHASLRTLHVFQKTLTPGAHSFAVRLANNANGGALTNANSRGWAPYLGVAYDPLGRGSENPNDYRKLEDPGDGSLFTLLADGSVPENDPAILSAGRIKFAVGTRFGLGGNLLKVGVLDGLGAFVEGDGIPVSSEPILVTDAWKVSGFELAAGNSLSSVRPLIFGEGARLELTESSSLQSRQTYTLTANFSPLSPIPTLVRDAEADGRSFVLRKEGSSLFLDVVPAGLLIFIR